MYEDRLFCGWSRILVQIISWLQIILNLAALTIGVVGCVLYFNHRHEYLFWRRRLTLDSVYHPGGYSSKNARKAYARAMGIWFGLCIMENFLAFISGIVLLVGVCQGDARKLRVWLWVTPLVLFVSCFNVAYAIFTIGVNHSVPRLVVVVIYYFCFWPVVIHKRELLHLTTYNLDTEEHQEPNFNSAAYKKRKFSVYTTPHDIKF